MLLNQGIPDETSTSPVPEKRAAIRWMKSAAAPDGRRKPWPEASHFDNDAMRDLVRRVVFRLFTFQELGVCEPYPTADHLDGFQDLE